MCWAAWRVAVDGAAAAAGRSADMRQRRRTPIVA